MAEFRNARFIASAHETHELPPDVGHEVAFAGRSNAGKSSAINAIAQRRQLAFVSKTPGRTQTVNFFECAPQRRLVDLPGYGYASVSRTERAHWERLIGTYFSQRASLKGLILIADARRGVGSLDEQLLRWYASSGDPVLVLLTKSDKLARTAAAKALIAAATLVKHCSPAATVELFSAVSGVGVRAAQMRISAWLDGNKKPPVKGE